MSKLGIIAIEWHADAVLWAIENKPTALEFMMTRPLSTAPMEEIRPGVKVSQVELVRMLAEASPKTLLIIRAYPDDYDHSDFQDRMLLWSEPFRSVSDRVVAHSINEPTIFNADDARQLNEYELGFIENMVSHGLIPMCFCLSESHLGGPTLDQQGNVVDWGNLPLWQYMASGVKVLAEAKGFLGFNEYDWPNWNSSRDRGYRWRLGHWELNLRFIQEYVNGPLPAVGIGESVLDGKIWTSRLPGDHPSHGKPYGYKKIKSGSDYLVDIDKIHEECYNASQVAFNLLFAWAPGHRDWNTYDVSVMKHLLGEYLRQSPPVYWEPREEGGMVDSPLASWREGVPLGNYSKGPTEKTEIVLHSTDGSFTSAVNWFLDPDSGVSAHYLVGRGHAGEPKIYQVVKESDIAHHATDWGVNTKSIGIECADDNLNHLTVPQRERLIALCKNIVARNPIERIRLHREIVATRCPQAITDAEGAQIIKEVLGGTEPGNEKDAKIAELEKKCNDHETAMLAARNTLDARLKDEP